MPRIDQQYGVKRKKARPAPKPPSPAGDRPQTHGYTKPPPLRRPDSPAGDRPQTHGPTGSARPASPAGDRPSTRHDGTHRPRRAVPPSPAGDRPQTHGPTGSARPASPAGDRPQTHGGAKAYRRSAAYRHTLREAYAAQSYHDRRRIAAEVLANSLHNHDAATLRAFHESRVLEDARQRAFGGKLRREAYPSTEAFVDAYLSHTGMTDAEAAQARAESKAANAHPRAPLPSATEQAKAERTFRETGKLPDALRHGSSEHFPKLVSALNHAPGGLVNDAKALAVGTYKDPIGVPTKTAKQAALAVAATPAGLTALALNPAKTLQAGVDDYAKRNAESYEQKLARVRKEGGFSEAADLATALSFGGGAAAKTALITKAPERAAKLLSGGARHVPKKGGPVRYAVGRSYDAAKARKYERIARKGELTALQHEALQANRAAGRVVAVVPARSGRKIAKVVANARGKAVAGLKYDQAKGPFLKLAQERFKLNKHEAQALWLGTEVGIRDAHTARKVGTALRDKMAAGRGDYKPKGRERRMDVIAQIDKVLKDPEKFFTPNFAAVMDRIHEHAQEISAHEPQFKAGTKENRRRAVQAYTLGLERGVDLPKPHIDAHGVPGLRYHDETDAEFNARIDKAASEAGLAPPTYFRSEKQQGLQADYGAHVVGGTAKSTGKQFLAKNLNQGIFDTSYDQFVRGYAHNLKATYNYPLVAKLDDKNRLRSFSPDSEPQGTELGTLMNRVNQADPEVRPGSVTFVNPGVFDKTLDKATDAAHGTDPESRTGEDAVMRTALEHAIVREGDPRLKDPEFLRSPGWKAWPTEADRELQAELHAGTAGGRVADIAKGATSKAILLTANVPWLALQVASEFAVTGVASKGRALMPQNVVGTARWWKAMNHRQRAHVATELGLNATGSDTAAIKLGATTQNHLVDAWRDLKAADFWHRPRVAGQPVATIISPVKWMRAADQGKTNVTRLLLAHSELTKHISPEGQSHLAGAMTNMARFGKDAERLLPVFGKPAAEQLRHLHENPHILEHIGETASTALGDWTTMTAKERMWANRFVMFYPFVRYSTRLLLHTLPVDHPAVTSLLAELGQLKANEYREIFGDDDLPWNIGKVYFGKTGDSKYIDLSRANPALNSAVTGLARIGTNTSNVPGAVVGSLPPYGQWLVDHLTGTNTFKGRPLRLGGDTNPIPKKPWEIGLDAHGKLALAEVQSLFYPAREAMNRLHPETQSDESSLLFHTPMNYKKPSEIKGNSAQAVIRRATANNAIANQQFDKEHSGGIANLLLGPLAPTPSRDAASSKERQYIKGLQAAADKTTADRKHYRDAHGGKNPTKPKAFGAKDGTKPFGARGGGKAFGTR